jgi:exopolyphosphatase / guanosine-5'-triphosphate,3'-diphosphate pyrophosphatase
MGDGMEQTTPVAVIDIGSTSVRLAIAQTDNGNGIKILESLHQEVSLGKDAFTKGLLTKATIEDCVKALRSFRKVLDEYGITSERNIRAIATSAVREASNREAFLDRVAIATGFHVEVIDEAQVNRYTYLSVLPLLKTSSLIKNHDTAVVEVGGGATSVLLVQSRNLTLAQSYRLGAFRLHETLEKSGVGGKGMVRAMETQVHRTVEEVKRRIKGSSHVRLLAIGGDMRFAADQLIPGWEKDKTARLQLKPLEKFTEKLLPEKIDALVRKYHLSYPDAETVVPALLAYVRLAEALNVREIIVSSVTMRDGVLSEMILGSMRHEEVRQQVIRSAIELGHKYDFDQKHAEHVAFLARAFFNQLKDVHELSPRYELTLTLAALLHEIGLFISNRSHHKHSMYIITTSGLFGLGSQETLLVALVARYHRKATPMPLHEGYNTLDRENRIAVLKMSALLRVADALDRSYNQKVKHFAIKIELDRVVLTVEGTHDLTLEQVAIREKGQLFEQVFGKPLIVRSAHERDD